MSLSNSGLEIVTPERERYAALSLSDDLHPVATLADWCRALGRPKRARATAEQRARVRRALAVRLGGRVERAANPKMREDDD